MQLIETDGKMEGVYACLSYCWGSPSKENQIGQTIWRNIEQYKEAIPLQELPQTVADAIRLCCKLGIEFLWVDRLCIVQDQDSSTGTDDWKTEASKMCDYYSKSALTISVHICSESSQSFLKKRQKGFQEQSRFVIVEYPDEESKLKSSLWLIRPFVWNEGSWFLEDPWVDFSLRGNKEREGWLGRGWTFQEWMLSPRVLHIKGLTIWDCFNGYANELDHRQMDHVYLRRDPEEFGGEIIWADIVAEYSSRHVSKKTDWLVALAGLAQSYRKHTGWTYLAGIWKEELPFSLLWQPHHGTLDTRAARRELTNQTTPSWSWAHSIGPASYGYSGDMLLAKASVSGFKCDYDPPGSLLTVVEAWIDIDGPLSAMQQQEHEEVEAGDEWWDSVPDDGDEYPQDAINQGAIKLLILAATDKIYYSKGIVYCALVLHKCGWKADGRSVFRRVGIATLDGPGHSDTGSTPPGEGPLWEKRPVRII